jgi:Tol biopolymer transport system component
MFIPDLPAPYLPTFLHLRWGPTPSAFLRAAAVLPESPGKARPRERFAWTLAVLLAAGLVVTAIVVERPAQTTAAPEMRVDIATPPTPDALSIALSPDGQKLAFVATVDGPPQLWVRSLDADSSKPLPGTDRATYPFWSPDSRSIGFFADGRLKRIDVAGGDVQTLAAAGGGRGASWSKDGVIVFAPLSTTGLFRVSASGGEVTAATRPDRQKQVSHRFPSFLSDGRRFLFFAQGTSPDSQGVYLGALDGSEPKHLLAADTAARAQGTDHVVFVRQGTLFVQRFDPNQGAVVGDSVLVADGVAYDGVTYVGAVSTADTGTLAYRRGEAAGGRELLWIDRSGRQIGTAEDLDLALPFGLHLSADGRRAVLDRSTNGNSDIWLFSLPGWTPTRFTLDAASDLFPIWSPDEKRIFFGSNRAGAYNLYVKDSSGAGSETLLLKSPHNKVPMDVSPDGRFLVYREAEPTTGRDLMALPLSGDPTPFPVVRTKAEEREGQFSPDSRWLAYQSDESGGRFEIYVQPFPGPGGKRQVSVAGGAQPLWRRDGKELFFIGLDGRLMAAPIRLDREGKTADVDSPIALFTTRIAGGPVAGTNSHMYAATPDGQRFLVISTPVNEVFSSPITLVLNTKKIFGMSSRVSKTVVIASASPPGRAVRPAPLPAHPVSRPVG